MGLEIPNDVSGNVPELDGMARTERERPSIKADRDRVNLWFVYRLDD